MIAIVDYRAGNVASVKKALDRVGAESTITSDPGLVWRADRIVLPGVGHFSATAVLDESGLRKTIMRKLAAGTPFLGICLGMQWMFKASDEAPDTSGLGLFAGKCSHFPSSVKSPHVGWNGLQVRRDSQLLRGIHKTPCVYFTHSYCAPIVIETVAECQYGMPFSAIVEREHLFGVQFHPEKSGEVGLKLLANFCAM